MSMTNPLQLHAAGQYAQCAEALLADIDARQAEDFRLCPVCNGEGIRTFRKTWGDGWGEEGPPDSGPWGDGPPPRNNNCPHCGGDIWNNPDRRGRGNIGVAPSERIALRALRSTVELAQSWLLTDGWEWGIVEEAEVTAHREDPDAYTHPLRAQYECAIALLGGVAKEMGR